MSTPTHTPGPWVNDEGLHNMMEFRIYSPTGRVIARLQDFTTFREDVEEAEANAAFIVRACNAHEELVKALETLLERANGLDQSATHDGLSNCNAITKARIAIAKAKAEGKE